MIRFASIKTAAFDEGSSAILISSLTGYSTPSTMGELLRFVRFDIAWSFFVATTLSCNLNFPLLIASYTKKIVISLLKLAGSTTLSGFSWKRISPFEKFTTMSPLGVSASDTEFPSFFVIVILDSCANTVVIGANIPVSTTQLIAILNNFFTIFPPNVLLPSYEILSKISMLSILKNLYIYSKNDYS